MASLTAFLFGCSSCLQTCTLAPQLQTMEKRKAFGLVTENPPKPPKHQKRLAPRLVSKHEKLLATVHKTKQLPQSVLSAYDGSRLGIEKNGYMEFRYSETHRDFRRFFIASRFAKEPFAYLMDQRSDSTLLGAIGLCRPRPMDVAHGAWSHGDFRFPLKFLVIEKNAWDRALVDHETIRSLPCLKDIYILELCGVLKQIVLTAKQWKVKFHEEQDGPWVCVSLERLIWLGVPQFVIQRCLHNPEQVLTDLRTHKIPE